jgi:hypothetical protein
MKNNAAKFNGPLNQITLEADDIFNFVKNQVEASRSEFNPLEEEVEELMSGKLTKQQKGKKKKNVLVKSKKSNSSTSSPPGKLANMIGDVDQDILHPEGGDSDTDSYDEMDDFDL